MWKNFQIRKNVNVPDWNDHCKDLYNVARLKFLLWNNAGRIRNGFLYDDMKTSRTNFRKSMRFCKSNEMKIRKEKLPASFYSYQKSKFWQEVR